MIIKSVINLLKKFRRASINKILWFKFLLQKINSKSEFISFNCNICGKPSTAPVVTIKHRELPSCYNCGSNNRFRSIAAVLSQEFFGEVIPIVDLKESPNLTGIGMSDTNIYAEPLSKKFAYENTFYHKEPRLDITSIEKDMLNKADFIISSDVFEHVPPPIEQAFSNLFKILKQGGVCIFSVPYNNYGETKEHFPDLYQYTIIKKKGHRILVNTTRDGKEQVFENLNFHGGSGATLELRQFSKSSVMKNIMEVGFVDIRLFENSYPDFGIFNEEDGNSLIISMRKP